MVHLSLLSVYNFIRRGLSEDLLKKSQSPSPSPAKVDLSPSPDLSTTSLLTTRNSAMKLFRTVSSDVIEECRVASLV